MKEPVRLSVCAFVLVSACGPVAVDSPTKFDKYVVLGDYEHACGGLLSSDVEMRKHAAIELAKHPDVPVATACVCKSLFDPESGAVDLAVADALKKTGRDDFADCFSPALMDARVTDRAGVVGRLGALETKHGAASLAPLLESPDPALRAAAIGGLRGNVDYFPAVLARVQSESIPEVKAAAVSALAGSTDPAVLPVLIGAASDPAVGVRIAAVKSLLSLGLPEADDAACQPLLSDSDESVKMGVLEGLANVRRPSAMACLQRRLETEEPSDGVRRGVMDLLRAAQTKEAKAALCDAMGPYVRMYVKDALPPEESALDIVYVQNDVDWDRSLECVSTAAAQGGYSCFGKAHLANWVNQLGGHATVPHC